MLVQPRIPSRGAIYVHVPFDGPGFPVIVATEEGHQGSEAWKGGQGVSPSKLGLLLGCYSNIGPPGPGYDGCPVTGLLRLARVFRDKMYPGDAGASIAVPVPEFVLETANPAMEKGIRHEDSIIGLVEQAIGFSTVPGGVYQGTGALSFMRASLDRTVACVPARPGPFTPNDMVIVEAKCKLTPDQQWVGKPPPVAYYMQCQAQMAVTGAGTAFLCIGFVDCPVALEQVDARNEEIRRLPKASPFRQDISTRVLTKNWASFCKEQGRPTSFLEMFTFRKNERIIAVLTETASRMNDLAWAIATKDHSDSFDAVYASWKVIVEETNALAICTEAAKVDFAFGAAFPEEVVSCLNIVTREVQPDGTTVDKPVVF